MRIERALATSSLGRVERGTAEHTAMTVADLQGEGPAFDWQRYFAETGAPHFERLNVRVPAFAREVSAILEQEPLSAIQAYLRWRLVAAMAPYLSADFVAENFAFHGFKTLRGARELSPRWKRFVSYVDEALGEALGQPFVERTPSAPRTRRPR